MSRLILLLVVMIWMSHSSAPVTDRVQLSFGALTGSMIFLAGYLVLVWVMATWSRRLSRQMGVIGTSRKLNRFNWGMFVARLLVPGWFTVGVFVLGWDLWVEARFDRLEQWPWPTTHIELPQAMLGILPALLTWMGLIWAQYPMDRALREQNMLLDLDDGLPVREPPTLGRHMEAALRLQVMFTLGPVLLILIVRDLTTIALRLHSPADPDGAENWVILPATLAVFIYAPLLLRRMIRTEPLPDTPLRRRLEQMCRDAGLKYRQILLWHTDGTMGNAAVMGVISPVRYIMMSDLLLETMTDTQIEAVFAHELGHVVHRHIMWYGVFALIMIGFVAGPGDLMLGWIRDWLLTYSTAHDLLAADKIWNSLQGLVAVVIGMGVFVLAFGYLSPRFERQADVYAARTMEKLKRATSASAAHSRTTTALALPGDAQPGEPQANSTAPVVTIPIHDESSDTPSQPADKSHVGEYGAGVFTSALHRVATINNIPVSSRNWTHGSIAHRMRYLHEISGDPAHTFRFDRVMNRLYATLLVALGTFGIWGVMHSTPPPAGTIPLTHPGDAK